MAKVKVTSGMVFERHEKKYRLSEETYQKLMEKLQEYMQGDQYGKEQPVLWVSPKRTELSLRDESGNILLELTTLDDAVQSAYTSPELQAGDTYGLYIDGQKKVEVTLESGMNTIGDDGGKFTGGYHRGIW